jgi:hypothetical protein
MYDVCMSVNETLERTEKLRLVCLSYNSVMPDINSSQSRLVAPSLKIILHWQLVKQIYFIYILDLLKFYLYLFTGTMLRGVTGEGPSSSCKLVIYCM